jgi:GTPase SAR1 family protein
LGGEKVGKTSFCRRYTLGESSSDLSVDNLTISGTEQYHKKLSFKLEDAQENADIELMDTKSVSGEDFETNLTKWNEWANGFLLVYSLLSKPSFECVSKAFNSLAKIRGFRLTPIVIVATHSDSNEVDKHLLDEALALATKFRCQHIQVSCKSGSGVEKTIELLADSVRRVKDISNPVSKIHFSFYKFYLPSLFSF